MGQSPAVIPQPEFDSPLVRAKLDTMLLLADALQPSLTGLQQLFPDDWDEIVSGLNNTFLAQIDSVTQASDAQIVWDQFLASLQVAKLDSRGRVLLSAAGQRLQLRLSVSDHPFNYIEQANTKALSWLKAAGKRRDVKTMTAAEAAPVRIYYDPKAVEYCASCNRTAREIGWKLQVAKHAFYGALIPDMILEHEYLSHLLPANTYLSDAVREIWLTAALFWEQRNALPEEADKNVRLGLWERFRVELARHNGKTDYDLYGPDRWDWLAIKMAFSDPGAFWRLTGEIIASPNRSDEAELIDELLSSLADLDDGGLRAALRIRWRSIREFFAGLNNIK